VLARMDQPKGNPAAFWLLTGFRRGSPR
jgi:hypothetical protein